MADVARLGVLCTLPSAVADLVFSGLNVRLGDEFEQDGRVEPVPKKSLDI